MEPWGIPTLTGYSCEDLTIQSQLKSSITKKRRYKAKYPTWNSLRLIMFVKKTSMPNPVKSIYLLNLEQPKTSQNQPKRPKTSWKNPKILQNNPKFWNLGNLKFSASFRFYKFWAEMPKFGYFGPKSINFLILTKFCLYPISKVLISNLAFAFCGSYQPITHNMQTNSMSLFCKLFGKHFFCFFAKSQNIMISIVFCFFKKLIANMTLKKSNDILSHTILKF